MDSGQIILFQTQGGETKIEVRLSNETVWLTADQMAELFQRNKSTISRHIKNIIESGELQRNSVVAENATTAADGKTYTVFYYNLDMIISVGYRVNSHRGVQFRQWATQVLKEYMIKGFILNDDLLKNTGQGNYFDELLSRIRDIRSSEKIAVIFVAVDNDHIQVNQSTSSVSQRRYSLCDSALLFHTQGLALRLRVRHFHPIPPNDQN